MYKTFPLLESCCPSQAKNIDSLEPECYFITCFTNRSAVVENWKNRTGSKVTRLPQWASIIDYKGLLEATERIMKESAAPLRRRSSVSAFVVAWFAAAIFLPGI
jgi:hypothetical protein